MSYQLRNLDKMHQLLGKETLEKEKVFCYVNDGTLVKANLESMSYSHNMNVSETYKMSEESRYLPSKILEKMLDEWYDKTLFKMSPADAQRRLHEILKKNCVAVIAGELEKVMGIQETGAGAGDGGGDGGGAGDGPAPSPGHQMNTIGNYTQPIMMLGGTLNINKQ